MDRLNNSNVAKREAAVAYEVFDNLKNHTFFHATSDPLKVADLNRRGFQNEYFNEDGRWFRDGNLGIGTYISADWSTALWFGNVLFAVTLQRGTRILDTSPQPSRRNLASIKREFGAEILSTPDPRKIIPHNKQLTLPELVALMRYHYHKTWDRADGDWDLKRVRHSESIHAYARLLRRYGFHGFGHPQDDNGIVIFQSERVRIQEVLLEIPLNTHWDLVDSNALSRLRLEPLKQRFGPRRN